MSPQRNSDEPGSAQAGKASSGGLSGLLAGGKGLRSRLPDCVKALGRRFLPLARYQWALWSLKRREESWEQVSTYPSELKVRLGIIREFTGEHSMLVAACRDMAVPYRILDITGPDWMQVVRDSGCDAVLVRPTILSNTWRLMWDERLRILTEKLGVKIFPSYDELWTYESKRRMHYWLEANDVPHPRTWVFYFYDDAMAFAQNVELPIVAKTDAGWGARGVQIFRDRKPLLKYVKRCFEGGIPKHLSGLPETEWGSVFLQEYLPGVAEWRMIRLGKYFMGHQKLKKGDFHSGSGLAAWYAPPPKLLDFTYELTEKGHFQSLNMDIFELPDGRYLVNEIQSYFGTIRPYQMIVDGKGGLFVRDAEGAYTFRPGAYCQNNCGNLRVEAALGLLGIDYPWRPPAGAEKEWPPE